MKYFILIAVFVLAMTGFAMAASSDSDTATASVTIAAWITVNAGADLNFGTVDASASTADVTASNTITVTTNDGAWSGFIDLNTGDTFLSGWYLKVNVAGGGDQTLLSGGTHTQATFSGTGTQTPGALYTLGGFALADPQGSYSGTITVSVTQP